MARSIRKNADSCEKFEIKDVFPRQKIKKKQSRNWRIVWKNKQDVPNENL